MKVFLQDWHSKAFAYLPHQLSINWEKHLFFLKCLFWIQTFVTITESMTRI
jgi:hypothetical protein